MQEIIYLIMNGADLDKAKEKPLEDRYVFLEMGYPGRKSEMERIPEIPRPWLIKTHMPYEMMEAQVNQDKAKFVVVMRNPKDNFVSMYYFYKMNKGLGLYSGTWDQFFEEFIVTERLAAGCPLKFNLGWWENRHKDNVLVTFYEGMKDTPREHVEKVAKFLGKDLTAEQIDTITEATSFASMKRNPATNYANRGPPVGESEGKSVERKGIEGDFLRKGIVGDWQNHFNEDQNKFVNELIERVQGKSGLKFQYTQ